MDTPRKISPVHTSSKAQSATKSTVHHHKSFSSKFKPNLTSQVKPDLRACSCHSLAALPQPQRTTTSTQHKQAEPALQSMLIPPAHMPHDSEMQSCNTDHPLAQSKHLPVGISCFGNDWSASRCRLTQERTCKRTHELYPCGRRKAKSSESTVNTSHPSGGAVSSVSTESGWDTSHAASRLLYQVISHTCWTCHTRLLRLVGIHFQNHVTREGQGHYRCSHLRLLSVRRMTHNGMTHSTRARTPQESMKHNIPSSQASRAHNTHT